MSRVAICLFDDNVTRFTPTDCLTGQVLTSAMLTANVPNAHLYLKEASSKLPDWTSIVGNFGNLTGANLSTAVSGAILFLEIKNRVVAVCFGSSVANINRERIVADFGLATAYKRISKRHYKQIETTTITNNPVTNARTIAIPSFQESFNVDTLLESITELSGKFFSTSGAILVKGKEFYSTISPTTLGNIQQTCLDLLADYLIVSVDPDYIRATSIRKVKEKKLVKFLDDRLVREVKRQSSNVFLVDFENNPEIHSYSLTPKGTKKDELEMSDIYGVLGSLSSITIEVLKQRRIYVFDSAGHDLPNWSVYKCLLLERKVAKLGHFVLYKGNWYRIEDNFIKNIKQTIQDVEIAAATVGLPAWKKGQAEKNYNIAAAPAAGGQCWDRTLYTNAAFPYQIEFADIVTAGHIMHVKKAGSSSLNSHLLLQTSVSAQLLKSDPALPTWLYSISMMQFKKSLLVTPSGKIKGSPAFLIVLLSPKKTGSVADMLPFFSLVSFNLMLSKIQSMGYVVQVTKV